MSRIGTFYGEQGMSAGLKVYGWYDMNSSPTETPMIKDIKIFFCELFSEMRDRPERCTEPKNRIITN